MTLLKKSLRSLFAEKKQDSLFAGLYEFSREQSARTSDSVIVTGVGRSGTHFMAKLYEANPGFNAYHLDDVGDSVGDAFNWYCKWYQPGANMNGFLQSRRFLASEAAKNDKRFLESNPLVALMIEDLIPALDAKAIVMVRHPRQVVESHFLKGWYRKVNIEGGFPVPSYPYIHDRPNHFFSRIMPRNESEFQQWKDYDTLGKISWMWMAVYRDIFRQINDCGIQDKVRFVYLNEFDHGNYVQLNDWLGSRQPLSESVFNEITQKRPGKGKADEKPVWEKKDKSEFNQEVSRIISEFKFIEDSKNWLF